MNDLRSVFSSRSERERIERLINKSPSPSLARNNLLRLIDGGGPDALKALPSPSLPALFRLLGASAFLSDILIRQGPAWPGLFQAQIETARKTVSEHLSELSSSLGDGASRDDLARLLRLHKQKEYLRIGSRDLLPSVSLEETTRELSVLADASMEMAYRFCRSELEREFGPLCLPGKERKNRFVILGMGKLGGEELNFSSDIDLIYLYEEEDGESTGGPKGKIAPREFFTSLGERISRVMGDITEEGFVFRIDLRLRPLGRNGPLVQPVGSALLYYESWGQCWERSALIKARPAAGDKELGAQFLRDLEPFIYRRYLDFTTIEELRHMKMRIEQELLNLSGKQRDLKLGRGGIREIEFFAQALQLVNGGCEPRIRERNTLKALELLARFGFIPEEEKRRLADAYRFLRQVEHKIQMLQEAHAHSIPEGESEEQNLARRLGYSRKRGKSERTLFWEDHQRHTVSVRAAFDRLFYGAQQEISKERESGWGEIWNDLDQEERIVRELKRLGFPDPARAYKNLLAIRDGERFAPSSPRRVKVMRILGPALMAEIAKSSAPGQALFNLAEFSHRVGARTGFLSLLAENPKTMRLLVSLFASSQFLTDLFLKRPELLDSLIRVDLSHLKRGKGEMLDGFSAALGETDDLEEKLNRIRRIRAEEFVRIGLHDLGGALELEGVLRQLSDLAEAALEAALRLACEEMAKEFGGLAGGRFAILGMGKLGGREIDYNSDLDLIFIYDAPEEAQSKGGKSGTLPAHDYFVRLGQRLITFLSTPTEEGVAYKIDMRLRPSGRLGPLVSSLDSFRHYHQTSSELWERQSLIKARFVAGDSALGAEAEKVAETFSYGRGLPPDGRAAIHHQRMRMEKELAKENLARFNLKKGRGGLVDIEFLVQMLQLTHGWRHPSLRQRGTLEALGALQEQKIIKPGEYRLLSDGYLFLRHLDHRLRLERDQSIDILEREPKKLHGIARAMGYKDSKKPGKRGGKSAGQLLLRDYESKRERIRACYERYFSL